MCLTARPSVRCDRELPTAEIRPSHRGPATSGAVRAFRGRCTVAHRWRHKRIDTPAELARKARYNSPEHRAARKRFTVLVEAGLGVCWRCGRGLVPGRWHVGHIDDGSAIAGPECMSCNLRAAARKGALVANARRKRARSMSANVTTLGW